eukprot:CAMPEP_0194040168 /NCGR_PEP_ID=MMETSP0009_2-20130614/12207_1 /TAXON_ID=210454 /ORGANISM="Grammatophora oceanica, Strain CCMP 410" /LENGTH=675 /DNA_ID=CAMNT_0038683219 /DNA_START=572 /DNA_END=2599 /DNA_ORIENTATION=+
MATVPDSSASAAASFANGGTASTSGPGGGSGILNFVTGPPNAAAGSAVVDRDAWTRGGRHFASSREVYTRSLFRLCLKFTTSEDEDEGKPEPATAFWTLYGRSTTIGNGGPSSHAPDDICRRMDDSMTGPSAGMLARITDNDGEQAAIHALRSGLTCGWHIRGDRGDAAVRVGKAKVFSTQHAVSDGTPRREAQLLSLAADRWILCKGSSFAAGNSVFNVEDYNESKQKITVHCSKGPMRGKLIDVHASRCPFVFGRAHEADLCIMDRELSRRHGAILFLPRQATQGRGGQNKKNSTGGVFILTDLESTNGSYMRLVGPYSMKGMGALTVGDEFIVGRTGFSVNRFDFGISEAIGARPTMEDRTIVIQSLMYEPRHGYYKNESKDQLDELAMTSFAAVFDGHGGDECSNYLVDSLPHQIRSHMLDQREALSTAIEHSRGARSQGEQTEDPASELMRKILKVAYLKTDKDFITPKTAPQSGSTAATVILMGRRLFAANVGDSRVVLCRSGGQCVELTSDHKPSRPDEAARVRAAGGFILHKRVMGELAITRAFGDKSFKMGIKAMLEEDADELANNNGNAESEQARDLTAPLVSAEPEIASMILSHNDEFLLLACDGLFDVFRSQDAIALARQELIAHRGEPAEVARILSDQAIRVRRSRDNVSILIIVLRPFWEL